MKNHRLYVYITGAVFVLILLVIVSLSLTNRTAGNKEMSQSSLFPTVATVQTTRTVYRPKTVFNIPTLPPEKGYGVDTDSLLVKTSENEIAKLASQLPYSTDFTTQTGIPVSILINPLDKQDNPWTLYVQIYGVDYNVPNESSNENYKRNKDAFRQASQLAFDWIKSKGLNPDRIIIQWGDRRFVEDKAQEWLK